MGWTSAIGPLIGLGGSIFGGIGGSRAARRAAQREEEGGRAAQNIIRAASGLGMSSIDQQNRAAEDRLAMIMDWQKNYLQPYRGIGEQAINQLSTGIGPGGEFTKQFGTPQPWQENQFNFETEPGYQWRLQEGMRALENSASAKGGILSGGALKAAMRYGQGFASNEYGNAWNRFQEGEMNKYNRYSSDLMNRFNIYDRERANRYNELTGLANYGQWGTGQLVNAAQNYGNISAQNMINSGLSIADIARWEAENNANLETQIANARASGYIGSNNAWQNQLPGLTSNAMSLWDLYRNRNKPPYSV